MHAQPGYDASQFLHVQDITLSPETEALLENANACYWANHTGKTWYGRCIFLSWYCSLKCDFCYRSTNKHKARHPKESRRSMGSVLLEALFCRVFGWRIEFLTGGYGMMPFSELVETCKNVSAVYGEKVWLNVGVLSSRQLDELRPYVKGICGSMETLHPVIHAKVCPEKPIAPYDAMFAKMDGFKKSIAVIVGLGDTVEDMPYLFDFVEKHKLDRITLYALKPVRGTPYTKGPTTDEYVQWVARLRLRFPKLEIIAGTNLRRCEELGVVMRAGASAMTKFPVTKQFGTQKAKLVKAMIEREGRTLTSNFTEFPENMDWQSLIASLPIEDRLKEHMLARIPPYLEKFRHPKDKDVNVSVVDDDE